MTFNAASGHLPGYGYGTFVADIVLGENAVTSDAHNGYALSIYRGASNASQTFTGSVSGSGNLGFGDDSAANTSTYVFTGDLTGLQGNIVANYFTSGGLRFGENETAGAYSSSASAVDNVIANITGTGAISTKGSITYNYTGGAHGEALSVDNSSITAERLTFGGGAAYTLNSDVVAKSSFTLSSGSSLTVVAEKTLDLSGAVVTLASAIQNSGTITLSKTTVFALDDMTAGADNVYSLITNSGSGSVTSKEGISFSIFGEIIASSRISSVSTSGGYSVTFAGNYADLVWTGADGAVWSSADGDKNWTSATAGAAPIAFVAGDSVKFNTAGANVTVSGKLAPGAMTVSAETSFTGRCIVRVDAANLTTAAALTLGENVVLDLGSSSSATNKNILGAGTVKFTSSAAGYDGALTLGSGFSGTIEYSGKFDASNGTNNPNAKFALSDGRMWGGDGTTTITNDIRFLTDYQIGDETATTIVLNGDLTQASGTKLTIGTNADTNVTFGGAGTVISDLRISEGTLTMNAGQATIKEYRALNGNLTINGATVYLDANNPSSAKTTITVSRGGMLKLVSKWSLWSIGKDSKIILNGGEISGPGGLMFSTGNPEALTAIAGSTSTISAPIRLASVTFSVEDDAKLILTGEISNFGSWVKEGAGELVISSAQIESTGGTTINGGVLTVKNPQALSKKGWGATTVNSGGVLKFAVDGGLTTGGVSFNDGAKFALDLTAYSNVAEETALTLITTNSNKISFNGLTSESLTSEIIESYFSEENSDLGEWASCLRLWECDEYTLKLTLTTIPEPSHFGVFAGLAALALAGTRRRRKKA